MSQHSTDGQEQAGSLPSSTSSPLVGTMEEQVMCYRAICEHGKVRAMAVDKPEYMKDHAKDIGQWLRGGLSIERVTVEEARKSDMTCEPCDEKWRSKRKKKKQPAETLFAG